MHFLRIGGFITFLYVLIAGCVPPAKQSQGSTSVNLNDPQIQKIMLLENVQNSDSISAYFSATNPILRLLAAKSMASIQDVSFGDSLISLLNDPFIEIRTEAAYALGQLKDTANVSALTAAFKGKDSIDVNNHFNASILEAIGKVGGIEQANQMVGVETYRNTDTLLLEGQMYGLYRFILRDVSPEGVADLCLKYLDSGVYSPKVRLIAAHILGRSKNIDLRGNSQLTDILNKESDLFVKMPLILAAGKNNEQSSKEALKKIATSNEDYRLRVNAVKALSNFASEAGIVDTILLLTNDANVHIANEAAAASLKIKNLNNLVSLWRADSIATRPMVKAKLLQAIMNNHGLYLTITKDYIKNMAVQRMNASTEPFIKAEYIKVMGYDPYQYQNIVALPVRTKVEELAKLSALDQIINHPDFIAAYKTNASKVKREILYYIASKVREGDPGVAAEGALILTNDKNQAKDLLRDSTFIEESWSKLSHPKDLETMQALNELSSYMFDKTYPIAEKKLKQIDFSRLTILRDSATVIIKTTKGNITILLFPKHAPATVSSFLDLCKSDFYDDKIFHRVVPNFVIQTGCPRGDGYGGVDFTIPSEVDDMKYDDEGFVGMASAGLHTEGSQFFITHSPTPHLDGRYTIFGKVIAGMDTVHKIEIGDKIIDAILTK